MRQLCLMSVERQIEQLQGFQRKYLRGLAHGLDPVVEVGRAGISEPVIEATAQALEHHELIKVRLQEPEDKKSMAAELAARSGAQLCGLIGHTVILYRARQESPSIRLPRRSTAS